MTKISTFDKPAAKLVGDAAEKELQALADKYGLKVRRGNGKFRGDVGALEVETDDGRRFWIGSGLGEADRRAPPPIGARITYRYRDLTPRGLPRFATYLRRHDDW